MTGDPKVVALTEGIDFNQALSGYDGRQMKESYFEPEDEDRAEELQELYQLQGRLPEELAGELQGLKKTRPRTLGRVVVTLLFNQYPDDKADGTEKRRRFKLAERLDPDDDGVYPTVRWGKEKRKIVTDLSGKHHGVLMHGRVFDAIEGRDDDEDDDDVG